MSSALSPTLFEFLRELKDHNDRDWFNQNKPRYKAEYDRFKLFAEAVRDQMSHHDQIEHLNVFRIYRDVRFSKDKSPYKTHFSFSMSRATKLLRGGYYFHLEPDGSFVGGGFWDPEPADLKRIREEIAADDKPLREIIADPLFRKIFGELQGERLKTAPQGFRKDHPAIDLLQLKQFLISCSFTDQEVLIPDFQEILVEGFLQMRPFFDYMSEVLTTDANGERIV